MSTYSRNIRLYPFIAALQAAWFVEGVWYFYWNRFASFTLIGILLSIGSVIAILLELPTGVFADKFGRKNSTVIGTFLLAFGSWLIALGGNIFLLFVGVVLQTIGKAFVSGALEALVYDSLKHNHQEKNYDHIASIKTLSTIITFAITASIGGFMYGVYFRLPHILMAICLTIGWLATFWLKEPPKENGQQKVVSITLAGLKQLANPNLRPYIVSTISILVIYFIYDWGFAKPAIAVHFNMFSREQGVAYALMAIINASLVGLLPRIRRRLGDLKGLRWLNVIAAIGFLLTIMPLGWWGITAMIGIEIACNLSDPWLSIIINKHIASQYRATALSAIQVVGRFPYLVINLILGALIDKGQSQIVFVILGAGVIVVQMVDLLLVKFLFNKRTTVTV
jgi:hypothetical protein